MTLSASTDRTFLNTKNMLRNEMSFSRADILVAAPYRRASERSAATSLVI